MKKIQLTMAEDVIACSVWQNEMTGEFWTKHDEESLAHILKEKRKEQKLYWLSNKKIEKIVNVLLEWMENEKKESLQAWLDKQIN